VGNMVKILGGERNLRIKVNKDKVHRNRRLPPSCEKCRNVPALKEGQGRGDGKKTNKKNVEKP